MLSYAHGVGEASLLGETIGENLRRTVERFADRDALVVRSQDYRATYRQLWDETTAVARGLLAHGVERGDRVGIWSPNRYEWVVMQYASARVGAILVNINPAYKTSELEYALGQSATSVLLLARALSARPTTRRMLAEVRPRLPRLRARSCSTTTGTRYGRAASARSRRGAARAREAALQFDDPINIQYTSGTTGFPKGATLSHHNILNNGYFVGRGIGLHRARPRLHPGAVLPLLRHGAGQPRLHAHGACMVVPGEAFDAAPVLETVAGRALHRRSTACRPCSSPSSTTRASPSSI